MFRAPVIRSNSHRRLQECVRLGTLPGGSAPPRHRGYLISVLGLGGGGEADGGHGVGEGDGAGQGQDGEVVM